MLRLVCMVTLLRVLVAAFLPLIEQEAYYAEYAAHPALSYVDHPPMVMWSIAAGGTLLGDSALGLRLGSLAFSFGTTLLGLRILKEWNVSLAYRRLWVLAFLGVPLFATSSLMAMTESPLFFFWTLTLWSMWRAREARAPLRWWLLAGVAAGGALLSKYTALFLAPGGVILLLFDRELRRQLRRPGPYVALLLSGLCFLPVVLWNAEHGWASFRHQAGYHHQPGITSKWFLELVGGQLGALTPWVAVILVLAAAYFVRHWRTSVRAKWVLAFGLPLPLFMLVQTPWTHAKLNWLLPAYLALGFGALVWLGESGVKERRPRLGPVVRTLFLATAFLFVFTPVVRWWPWSLGNAWSAWPEVAARAEHWRKSRHAAFYFATNHKDAAQLTRALRREHHGALPAPLFAQNTIGQPGHGYDFWTEPQLHKGQDAIWVSRNIVGEDEPRFVKVVPQHFESVELLENVEIEGAGYAIQKMRIFYCRKYRGP